MRSCGTGFGRSRIHGTTRRQVGTHFIEVEQPALQPLPADGFPFFTSSERTVHTDGHVEVGGAFYPVPLALRGQQVCVRWDAHLVRVFHDDTLVAVHARVAAGLIAPPAERPRRRRDSKPLPIAWWAGRARRARAKTMGRCGARRVEPSRAQ